MAIQYNKIATVKASADRLNVRPGRYIFEVRGLKEVNSTQGKGDFVFMELRVVHVLDASFAAADPNGPHRVGECPSWCFDLKHAGAWASLKAALVQMLAALSGGQVVSEDAITEEFFKEALGPNQPFNGLLFDMEFRLITTKKGTPFTKGNFKRPVTKEQFEQLAGPQGVARLKELGIELQ